MCSMVFRACPFLCCRCSGYQHPVAARRDALRRHRWHGCRLMDTRKGRGVVESKGEALRDEETEKKSAEWARGQGLVVSCTRPLFRSPDRSPPRYPYVPVLYFTLPYREGVNRRKEATRTRKGPFLYPIEPQRMVIVMLTLVGV